MENLAFSGGLALPIAVARARRVGTVAVARAMLGMYLATGVCG
jgi:hypothetical protein